MKHEENDKGGREVPVSLTDDDDSGVGATHELC